MINQEKIGAFILELRKEQGMTQKQLADKIGVSDKAISRWETGRGIPDTSIMPELCDILQINVNELLSGQHLSEDDYNEQAEVNMVDLMKNSEEIKRESRLNSFWALVGVGMLFFLICLVIVMSGGFRALSFFIDIPSLVIVLGIQFIGLVVAGYMGEFFLGFKLIFASKKITEEEVQQLLPGAKDAFDFSIRTLLFGGAVASIIGLVAVLALYFDDYRQLGPHLAVTVLTLFYSFLFSLFLAVLRGRLHKFG